MPELKGPRNVVAAVGLATALLVEPALTQERPPPIPLTLQKYPTRDR